MIKALIIIAIVLLCLFVLSFVVYFFNLDMKLMSALAKPLGKVYDKRKRDRRV